MFSLQIVWLTVFVFMCYEGLVTTHPDDDGYVDGVKNVFGVLKENNTVYDEPVKTAYDKMNEFSYQASYIQHAIAMINLYTQGTDFTSTLDKEMRKGNPSELWRKAGNLINRGLDILEPTLHKLTYRGCRKLDDLPIKGDEYRFRQITSTTLDKQTAFSSEDDCDKFLFVIKDVRGVLVDQYSAFSFEKEVLLKSTEVFDVTGGPIQENKYIIYYLNGRGYVSGCDTAFKVNLKTMSVLVVFFLLFN